MKVGQLLATIPEALPADYAAELIRLQSQAPPMGAAFVRRRMRAELGAELARALRRIRSQARRSGVAGPGASRESLEGEDLACKLQYPEMASAVETDLAQLDLMFSLHRRMSAAIDTREIAGEIRERVREELDYRREAKIAQTLWPDARRRALRPRAAGPRRLVDRAAPDDAMARRRKAHRLRGRAAGGAGRDRGRPVPRLVAAVPALWRHSRRSAPRQLRCGRAGRGGREVEGVNLFDYGCVRIFPPRFVLGVVELYRALREGDQARLSEAYAMWGFPKLTRGTFEAMTLWARFICGPILDDRVRTAADGVSAAEYGRKEIGAVMRALRAEGGGLVVPREFVFLERATIGLGGAFLRLGARLNFHRLYEDAIADFDEATVGTRQAEGLKAVGLKGDCR